MKKKIVNSYSQYSIEFRTTSGDKNDARLMLWFGSFEIPGESYFVDDVTVDGMPNDPSRIEVWKGNDDSGTKVYDSDDETGTTVVT